MTKKEEAAPVVETKPIDIVGDLRNNVKAAITRAKLSDDPIGIKQLVNAALYEFIGAYASLLVADPTDTDAARGVAILSEAVEEL